MKTLIASYYLVTFICPSPELLNCEVYNSKPMLDIECEQASTKVLEMARTLELKETILTYCTEDINDLPIKPMSHKIEATKKEATNYEF